MLNGPVWRVCIKATEHRRTPQDGGIRPQNTKEVSHKIENYSTYACFCSSDNWPYANRQTQLWSFMARIKLLSRCWKQLSTAINTESCNCILETETNGCSWSMCTTWSPVFIQWWTFSGSTWYEQYMVLAVIYKFKPCLQKISKTFEWFFLWKIHCVAFHCASVESNGSLSCDLSLTVHCCGCSYCIVEVSEGCSALHYSVVFCSSLGMFCDVLRLSDILWCVWMTFACSHCSSCWMVPC